LTTKYINTWNLEIETIKEYPSHPCYSPTGTCNPSWDFSFQELKEQGIRAIVEKVNQGLGMEAQKEGLQISNIKIQPEAWITTRRTRRPHGRFQEEVRDYAKLHLKAVVTFESSQPIQVEGESLTLVAMKILKWIIEAVIMIVVAWFIVESIKSWLMSMTVKKSEVVTVVEEYDEEGNLIKRTTTTSTTTGADPLGIAGVGGIAVILVVVVLFFLVGFKK